MEEIVEGMQLSSAPDIRTYWLADANGKLRTVALYRLLHAARCGPSPAASFVWRNGAPLRVQFFAWLLLQDRIQSRVNLAKRGVIQNLCCELCPGVPETANHIFLE